MDSEYWQHMIPQLTEEQKDTAERNADLAKAIFTGLFRELYNSPIEDVIDIPEVV